MRPIAVMLAGLALGVISPWVAQAHSLDDLDAELGDRERYFQSLDRVAPDFNLMAADGGSVTLHDLRGKVVVLHFIYTHCPDFCPLHAEKVAEIQGIVNQSPMRALVRFVTITTDPERDDAEVMREYGPAHDLDPANWTFLTSGPDRPDETRRLAEAFGHKFTPTSDGLQMHGVVTHVIDQQGRLRANFHGLRFESSNLAIFVNALAKDDHGS